MKLSEAIRLNGMMKPQGWGPGSMVSLDAPCALGGALQSIGKQPKDEGKAFRIIGETWEFIYGPAKCPCGSDHRKIREKREGISIGLVIILLSDYHRWTRTQIADWVATVEPAEEVQRRSKMKRKIVYGPFSPTPLLYALGGVIVYAFYAWLMSWTGEPMETLWGMGKYLVQLTFVNYLVWWAGLAAVAVWMRMMADQADLQRWSRRHPQQLGQKQQEQQARIEMGICPVCHTRNVAFDNQRDVHACLKCGAVEPPACSTHEEHSTGSFHSSLDILRV